MVIFCPYCETENPEDTEFCSGCGQRIDEELDYELPIRELTEVTTKLIKKEIPFTQEFLEKTYGQIMNSVQLIMDQTMLKLQDNLGDLKKIQTETRKEFADEDFESFQRFMRDFEAAQNQINAGLQIARESFFSARSFEELEKGHVDLSAANAAMHQGLARLESLTFESQEPELMTVSPVEIPDDVDQAINVISKVMDHLHDFVETGVKDYLESATEAVNHAAELLEKALDEYEEPDEVLEKKDEILSGGMSIELKEELIFSADIDDDDDDEDEDDDEDQEEFPEDYEKFVDFEKSAERLEEDIPLEK